MSNSYKVIEQVYAATGIDKNGISIFSYKARKLDREYNAYSDDIIYPVPTNDELLDEDRIIKELVRSYKMDGSSKHIVVGLQYVICLMAGLVDGRRITLHQLPVHKFISGEEYGFIDIVDFDSANAMCQLSGILNQLFCEVEEDYRQREREMRKTGDRNRVLGMFLDSEFATTNAARDIKSLGIEMYPIGLSWLTFLPNEKRNTGNTEISQSQNLTN